jgi:hypothetical protein
METGTIILASLVSLAVCAVIAGLIAAQKKAGEAGAVVGFLLGPIGVVVACFLDMREKCPTCRGRVDDCAKLCPQCHTSLVWSNHGSQEFPILRPYEAKEIETRDTETRQRELEEKARVEAERFRQQVRQVLEANTVWYYYQVLSTAVGPVTIEELRELALKGIVNLDTPVRRSTSDQWMFAEKLAGLFPPPPS